MDSLIPGRPFRNKLNRQELARGRRLMQQERNRLRQQVRSLNRRVEEATKDLDGLAGSLISAQEEERARIARELHDDFGQRTAVVELHVARLAEALATARLEAEREMALIRQQTRMLSIGIREVSHRLHPSVLTDLGLCAALSQLADEFAANSAAITLNTRSVANETPLEIAFPLYRIAQEALHNAAKHAPGAPVIVALQWNSNELRLTVKDRGPGFQPDEVRSRCGGLGLLSMRERARLAGGCLIVRSAPGQGTILIARVPFRRSTSSL